MTIIYTVLEIKCPFSVITTIYSSTIITQMGNNIIVLKLMSKVLYQKMLFSEKKSHIIIVVKKTNVLFKIERAKNMIYGYARISRPQQSIDRQIRNIKNEYPEAVILQEAYTGTRMDRPEWSKLLRKIKFGDTIVFDSVSRMSRNADEGVEIYFKLYEKGIQLIFLKEHYIDTDVYSENMRDKIELQGTDEDEIFKGLNNYFRKLAARQIRIAFDQAEKEVQDLRQRTREGIETARLNGKQIGQKPGNKLKIKKETPAKEQILKYSKDFNGSLPDPECIKLIGISRNTYYKYKRDLKVSL